MYIASKVLCILQRAYVFGCKMLSKHSIINFSYKENDHDQWWVVLISKISLLENTCSGEGVEKILLATGKRLMYSVVQRLNLESCY